MFGIIYKIVNILDGKCYVGQTRQSLRARWTEHKKSARSGNGGCPALKRAMRKYGIENFVIQPVVSVLAKTYTDELERLFIKELNSMVPHGYNLDSGGSLHKIASAETRAKISAGISGINHPSFGKHLSEEHRRKIAQSNTGKKAAPEAVDKIRKANEKPVFCVELNQVFESARKAAAATGAEYRNISACLHGKRYTAAGYHWQSIEK